MTHTHIRTWFKSELMCNFQGLLFPWVWLLWGRLLDDKAGARCKTRKLHGSSNHTFCTSLCILALEVFKPALVDYYILYNYMYIIYGPYDYTTQIYPIYWGLSLASFSGHILKFRAPFDDLGCPQAICKSRKIFWRQRGRWKSRRGGWTQTSWWIWATPMASWDIMATWHCEHILGHGKWSLYGGNHPIYPLVN